MDADAIVVGSGLAGLTAAALLANAGRRVQVLEAHEHVGGYGHTFSFTNPRGTFRFNAQLHYVWNCGPGETVDAFLGKLGLREAVTFERYDPAGFDHMRAPGLSLDVPNDWDLLGERLSALFPAAAIRPFLDDVRELEVELQSLPPPPRSVRMLAQLPRYRRVLRYRNATLADAFDRFELPQGARTLLALQWPDFLLPPSQLSFFAWTLLFAGYVRGAWYPTRHFEHVVDTLVAFIRAHGGEVLTKKRAIGWLREGRRILGVRVEDVDEDGASLGTVTEHRAADVVCNMDPRRAAEMIGLEHFSTAVRRRLDYTYSPSSFVAYCAVEGISLKDHGFGRWNLFHTDDLDLERAFSRMMDGDYSAPSFAMTTPTLLTDAVRDCPEGTEIFELLTVADHSRFQALKISSGKPYRDKKNEVLDALLSTVERHYVPNLREHIVFKMTGSPTTSERYCLAPRGHSYGSSMIPSQMGAGRLDHRTSLDGFHFCSASAGYAGFAGTIWTGCTLYEHLTRDAVLSPAPARVA